jgi:hypothetical protein
MKPPRCIICDKRFSPKNGISGGIYFKKTPEDIAYTKQMEADRKVGHPAAYAWFCKKHYAKAKRYKKYYLKEALKKIKSKWSFMNWWSNFFN